MKDDTKSSTFALLAGDDAFDPLEDGVRRRVRCFIEAILEEELQAALGRGRYERRAAGAQGHRNGHRERQVIGTFGVETVKVPRARLIADDGRTGEWRSKALRRYQRLTRKAEALIAAVYLAGTNTRRVRRALFALFEGAVGKGEPCPRHRFERHGERQPGLAQGQDRLGGLVRPQPGR